ncbi:MAG TPA: ATP-binding cassette domain-containing protein, partial [Acidimicrobiales bacterium]|nr:ATP-binding cassette domain-containing protein [Acidimicrobiales bacterium]
MTSDLPEAAGTPEVSPDGSEPLAVESETVLEVRGVTKSFGPLKVLRGVDLSLHKGEVLGLVGDNGAGKSTLVKILSGFSSPDSGQVLLNGQEVHLRSVEDATAQGIETVYQDLALVPQLPVYQNLFLNHEITYGGPLRLLDKRKMRYLSESYLNDINVYIQNVDTEADRLSGGQRQAIAVARATRAQASILLLDEPLAAMGARESRLIIDLVKELASSRNVSMIIIDHNYAHLFQLCDRVNVMQGGRITIDRLVRDTSLEELTELMVSSYRSQLQQVAAVRTPELRLAPPPALSERNNNVRLGVIGLVFLAILGALIGIVASKVYHHASVSTVTTVATTTTIVSVPAHQVVLKQSGSGIVTTAPFHVSLAPWTVAWAYKCSPSGNFILEVNQGGSEVASDAPVDELGTKGSGTAHYGGTGLLNLRIISECSWKV